MSTMSIDRSRRPYHRTRTRTRFQLEALEDRCLLSSISAITEFPVPSVNGYVTDGITKGPDGNLWFTESASSAIGMINPTTHAVSSFSTPTASSNPQGITAGPDGNLWFTESAVHKVGVINPTTHAISEFSVPKVKGVLARPFAITAGPDGNVWFAENGAAQRIGEINPTTHAISQFPISQPGGALAGVGITAGPDGNIWFTGAAYLGAINPTTHAITYYSLHYGDNPYGIVTGPDGNLWFTDTAVVNGSAQQSIGMFNPATQAESLFGPTTGNNGYPPWGITAGPDGDLWFAVQSGQIGQINPTTDAITEYQVPYANSSPQGITTGPDGNLWFTDSGTKAVGVATLSASGPTVNTLQAASSSLSPAVTSTISVTSKTPASRAAAAPGGGRAPDPSLAPLVLDSPELWDGLRFKKRSHAT
jgi:streptogramin lyase